MLKTDLSAFDPVTSQYDTYCLNKIDITTEDCSQISDKQTTRKVECARYTVKEMDYRHLECIVMAQAIRDYKTLVKFTN